MNADNTWSGIYFTSRATLGMLALSVMLTAIGLGVGRSFAWEIPAVTFVSFAIFATIRHRSRCPACGERFFKRGSHRAPFTTVCLHCNAPMFSVVTRSALSEYLATLNELLFSFEYRQPAERTKELLAEIDALERAGALTEATPELPSSVREFIRSIDAGASTEDAQQAHDAVEKWIGDVIRKERATEYGSVAALRLLSTASTSAARWLMLRALDVHREASALWVFGKGPRPGIPPLLPDEVLTTGSYLFIEAEMLNLELSAMLAIDGRVALRGRLVRTIERIEATHARYAAEVGAPAPVVKARASSESDGWSAKTSASFASLCRMAALVDRTLGFDATEAMSSFFERILRATPQTATALINEANALIDAHPRTTPMDDALSAKLISLEERTR